jgi:hypothetical protein
MALIDLVRAACRRLAPTGWCELLNRHGLDISAANLADELARELPAIDRRRPGFEDFAAEGRRGVEPGVPARSLLYHAFASPNVVTGAGGRRLGAFPTRAEIEAVENYVFGVRPPSLTELAQRFPGARMAIAAFAVEYRPGGETVHRRHADLCFSRTGVARVGTSAARYEPDLRGFHATVAGDNHAMRVLPAAYAAYLAVQLRGEQALFGPMGFDRLRRVPPDVRDVVGPPNDEPDGMLDFWVPLHKLFSGPECLRGHSLTVAFETQHVNEKIRRVHTFLRAQGHDSGWGEPDIDRPPFTFTKGIAELSRLAALGGGLLVPVVHTELVEPAVYRGTPLTYRVPADPGNPWAPSLLLRSRRGNRPAPEYVHARHLVDAEGRVRDLNDLEDVAGRVRRGGYRAQHYVDFTGDGFVRANCPELTAAVPRTVPAYSLVTAPDFYPACDQRELLEWWFERVPTALRARIWRDVSAPPPLTLADGRLAPNLQLPDAGFRPEDRTVTAIVSLPHRGPRGQRPLPGPATKRHGHLPDAASNVFAPGWDTSRDETGGTIHLAAYGLGSPFPEDAKLCAALSSFWPAVAPDAGRSFERPFPTATPMTDHEIGSVGALPWDGIAGPVVRGAGTARVVEYHRFEHADYVHSALRRRFSLALTAQVDSEEYQTRMLALARALLALRAGPGGDGWRIISFRRIGASDPELGRAELEAAVRLLGARYRISLAQLEEERAQPVDEDHRHVRVPLTETATAFTGSGRQLLLRRAGAGWRAVTTL